MIHFEGAHIGHTHTLFHIPEVKLEVGEVYILVGRNGAGKSTLLNAIVGQQALQSGRIHIDGQAIHSLRPEALSRKIAFVRAQFPQVEYLEVSQYIALGRTPYTNALGRLSGDDLHQVDAAIAALEIERLRGKYTAVLSDGERQLVAIARAVAQNTPVILLDEPTAFLDYPNKQAVLSLLQKIAREQQKCILLSSHDIDLSIEAHCPFFVIPTQGGEATLIPAPVSKETLLALAFS
jgi:iron complex transport system ATP-binding protein